MAKKGGRKGGGMSSAARSAAAKKGWETRRRGGGAKATAPSKPKAPPKTTTARGRARTAETRARAAVKAGGGTKAARSLLTAQRARDYYKATGTGTKRSRTRTYGPASGIRRTGGLKRPVAGNAVRPTTGLRRAPLRQRSNAIRTYEPKTPQGLMDKGVRGMVRGARKIKEQMPKLRELGSRADAFKLRMARQSARDIAERLKPGLDGELSSIALRSQGSRLSRAGIDVIRRRAARATAAAERGSKAGARAREIYGAQLASTGPGKPSRKAKSGIRPGPRNTKGAPKKKRKPRKR